MPKDFNQETWQNFEKEHFGQKTTWILVPNRHDAYSPLIEGTLEEAIADALKHAIFWRSKKVTVFHSREGRRTEPDLKRVAEVTIPDDSPLRWW